MLQVACVTDGYHLCGVLIFVVTGKTFSKKETFGAFPLQVQGYGDLHDSLEGAMAQVEIEPVGPEGTHKSGQEVGTYHTIQREGRDFKERLYPEIASFPTPSTDPPHPKKMNKPSPRHPCFCFKTSRGAQFFTWERVFLARLLCCKPKLISSERLCAKDLF